MNGISSHQVAKTLGLEKELGTRFRRNHPKTFDQRILHAIRSSEEKYNHENTALKVITYYNTSLWGNKSTPGNRKKAIQQHNYRNIFEQKFLFT